MRDPNPLILLSFLIFHLLSTIGSVQMAMQMAARCVRRAGLALPTQTAAIAKKN
jgi:hypothetical protein